MVNAQKLDKMSGFFFFSAFMLSKLQYLPFALVAGTFRFLSLGFYLTGYGLWFASNYLRPGHQQHHNEWYGFAKMKEQFILSSAIGFIATALSVAAVFFPVLFPPAAWLFVLGNVVWAIGEYHKLKNPPKDDDNFSTPRQKAYLAYTVTTTGISLIAAVSATLMILFPPAIVPITIFSLLLCTGLGFLSFEFWLNSSFGAHKPDSIPGSHLKGSIPGSHLKDSIPGSYLKMSAKVGASSSYDNSSSSEPHQGQPLFFPPSLLSDSLLKELDESYCDGTPIKGPKIDDGLRTGSGL